MPQHSQAYEPHQVTPAPPDERTRRRSIRRRTTVPPLLSQRELVRLGSLIVLLLVVLIAMVKLGEPSAWTWFFVGGEGDGSEVAAPAGPDREPPLKDSVLATAKKAAPKTPDQTGGIEGQPNPLGLVQIDECRSINTEYLKDVKDEIDPQTRVRLPKSEILTRRRDSQPALYQILCVAAMKPPEALERESRKDIFLANLWRQPDTYRGQLIHVEGLLYRCEKEAEGLADRNPYGIDTLYRGYILIPDLNAFAMLLFTSKPAALPLGTNLNIAVAVDAYFLKLYTYEATDGQWHGIPMLLGYEPTMIERTESLIPQVLLLAGVLIAAFGAALAVFWWYGKRDERLAAEMKATLPAGPEPDLEFLSGPSPDSAQDGPEERRQPDQPGDRSEEQR